MVLQRDTHVPYYRGMTGDIETLGSDAWQARLFQETLRRRCAGSTPEEATKFFYDSIAADPISRPGSYTSRASATSPASPSPLELLPLLQRAI